MSDFDSMLMKNPWEKEYKPNNAHPFKHGVGCTVHSFTWIGDKVEMGDNVSIQAFAFIPNNVVIGNNVFIGPHTCFTNDKYPPSSEWLRTTVEDDVTIGANATLLPGITLGKGCRIGAGAVVTKSVPPGEIWVGNPAKPL